MPAKYPRGYCPEIDPQHLRPGQYATFQNLTQRTGAVRPVRADATHSAPTWTEQNAGTLAISEPLSIDGTGGYLVHMPHAGGVPQLRTPAGTSYPIAFAAPGSPGTGGTGYTLAFGGPENGEEREYAAAWRAAGGYHSGLGSVATAAAANAHVLFVANYSGTAPTVGLVATTADGTATIHEAHVGVNQEWYLTVGGLTGGWGSGATFGYTGGTGTLKAEALPASDLHYLSFGRSLSGVASLPGYGTVVTGPSGTGTAVSTLSLTAGKSVHLKGVTGYFGVGDQATWPAGTGTGTGVVETSSGRYASVSVSAPGSPPTGVIGWELYGLDDAGVWRRVGTAATGTAIADTAANLSTLDAYDGPLRINGLPETLVVPGTCQAVAIWKGCTFLFEGNLLRWSEGALTGKEYRWFREGFTIDAGATGWALIPRGEYLEAWTARGLKLVVGNAPYFEIREPQIGEPAVSKFSIVPTSKGTFYQARDGIRLFSSRGEALPISQGVAGPWFDALTSPAATLAGASDGVYYLTDSAGRCLVYDWEAEEFRSRTFAAAPSLFRWNETARALVVKVGGNYYTVETDAATAVVYAMQLPTVVNGRLGRLPVSCTLDHDGETNLSIYADEALAFSGDFPERVRDRIRLPRLRASRWYATLSGTTAEAGFTLHDMRWSQ